MFYDANIAWLGAYAGTPNHAVCVTCHNPHGTSMVNPGTGVTDGTKNNKMMIYRWVQPTELCNKCHP